MVCHQLHMFFIVFLKIFNFVGTVADVKCSLTELFSCLEEETCVEVDNSTGICQCRKGFQRTKPNGYCLPLPSPTSDYQHYLPTTESVNTDGSPASAIAAGVLVPLFLICVMTTLVFAAKKYRWLQRMREQAHQLGVRNYDTVLVNQDDDPPIA